MLQAALVYSVPVLAGSAGLALTLQIWQTVSDVRGIPVPVLLGAPYVAFLIATLGLLIRGGLDIGGIRLESGLYCGFVDGIPGDVSAGLVILLVATAIFFEIRILKLLLRNRIKYPDTADEQLSIPIVIRVTFFNLIGIVAIASGVGFLTKSRMGQDLGNIVIAILPVSFVLVFGTQPDILHAWMFWKTRDDRDDYPPNRQGKV